MGHGHSKDRLLYEQVNYGNVAGIKALREEGASLEWTDHEGRTPLILACTRADLLPVAKVLIELGADVNACRSGHSSSYKGLKRRRRKRRRRLSSVLKEDCILGRSAGTALHHAAKRGLEQSVHLLLSHGANPFLLNDDCQTALDLAREKGHCNVVRSIENHICLYSGWLKSCHGPAILESLIPLWLTKKVWVVVLPCDRCNPTTPSKLELALYPGLQAAKPRITIPLHKARIDQSKLNHSEASVIIEDVTSKTRYRFSSTNEGDNQELQKFYIACKGNTVSSDVIMSNLSLPNPCRPPNEIVPLPTPSLDAELAMAIKASLQTAMAEGVPIHDGNVTSSSEPRKVKPRIGPSSSAPQLQGNMTEAPPSAPPILDHMVGRCGAASSTCVICLDAPVEGACIPCGHMAGCMECLKGIESKNWGCPVCRTKIDQIVRLYAV